MKTPILPRQKLFQNASSLRTSDLEERFTSDKVVVDHATNGEHCEAAVPKNEKVEQDIVGLASDK